MNWKGCAMLEVASYLAGEWVAPGEGARPIHDAVTGEVIGRVGNAALDVAAARDHARKVGGPALRAMTFHERARMLKALAQALDARKDELYELSYATGGTLADHRIDIDGGIGTLFVYASKGRRELPDKRIAIDGAIERTSREGSF
ncbi:MAG: aldehyde dehydrogenase family protein, partial [Alphaproteobacteria bacterium]